MTGSQGVIQEGRKILLIEDNADIQDATCFVFELHWPDTQLIRAYNGEEGLALMRSESPDVVLLDLGLPDIDGMKVLKEIRSFSDVPIVIFTVRGEESDKVRGLELGADDYVVKPFAHRELLARLSAVLQRRQEERPPEAQPAPPAQLKLDLENGLVTRGGQVVKLTGTEVSLLNYLASAEGRPQSDVDILNNVWGPEYSDCSKYLQAYILRLADKVEVDPRNPQLIVREGDGYRFVHQSG